MIPDSFLSDPLYVICSAVVLGLVVGSFLNVVIYRLPIMMERDWKRECENFLELSNENAAEPERFNLAVPNSCCPSCKAPIRPWQNIPVLSYILLGGKCAHCSTSIALRYPIIEAITGLMSGIVAWHFGAELSTLGALGFTWALIALTMIDADHKLLPDQITLPLLWAGLIANNFGLYVSLHDAVWGAIGGYLSLWCVYWGFKLLTGKEGMGYGDFKLLAALGAWAGWQSLLAIILISSLVGAVIGSMVLLLNRQGRNTTIPFGPYLASAGWITLLWGDQIIDAYLRYSGLN